MKRIELASILLFAIMLIDFIFYPDSCVATVHFISAEFMFWIYLAFGFSLLLNLVSLTNEFYREYKDNKGQHQIKKR